MAAGAHAMRTAALAVRAGANAAARGQGRTLTAEENERRRLVAQARVLQEAAASSTMPHNVFSDVVDDEAAGGTCDFTYSS